MRAVRSTVLAALTVLTACGTGESTTPGLEGSPDLTPITVAVGSALPEDSAPASTAASTTVDGSETTTTAPPESTTAPSTSAPSPEPTVPEATCTTLRTEGYETRKATVVALDAADVATVQKLCGDDLQRLNGALAIQARSDAINANEQAIEVTGLLCGSSSFTVTVTNTMADPVGVQANFVLTDVDTDTPITSGTEPIVIWSLAPGESQEITGEYVEVPDDRELTCNFGLHAFDATPGDADASLGTTTQPQLTGDDPAIWFPELIAFEVETTGSGDPNRAAVTEDIRSTFYDVVVDTAAADAEPYDAPAKIIVCQSTIILADADHASFVYYAEHADRNELRHGVFRRGADAQWRWLGVARYIDTPSLYSCGTPTPGR